MANELNNLHLVNAPAGSGKTTTISKMVNEIITKTPDKNILCITYTNRAANELKNRIKSNNVFIGTIHMFINSFTKTIFKHKDIISLYFDLFGNEIKKRIDNTENKDSYLKSNEKYIEKYGSLSFDTIKENVKEITYNESTYSAYYYGRLGHDDLLIFAEKIFEKFPKISLKLSKKYSFVFLDEYQDTSKSVLNIFYNSIKNTDCQLYLLGDKMQQIYDAYDGSFEAEFNEFNLDLKLNTNYRSSSKIIDILNKLYNDSSFEQLVSEKSKEITMDFEPKVIITNSIESAVSKEKQKNTDALILYVFNKKRFEEINALNLFNSISKISAYSGMSLYKASDILLIDGIDNPDSMMMVLWYCQSIVDLYKNKKIGKIVQILHHNKKVFNCVNNMIKTHSDKSKLKDIIENLKMEFEKTQTIKDFLLFVSSTGIFNDDIINDFIGNEEYEDVLSVNISEFHNLVEYLKKPNVSTQHGVKGESHNTVIFVSEDSNNTPKVNIYEFYKLWSQNDISLKTFEDFYYSYKKLVDGIVSNINIKINDMKKVNYDENNSYIDNKLQSFYDENTSNTYFCALCKNDFDNYFAGPNVSRCKLCLKISKVFGTLQAYRIFYVGCSRARKNLCIIIDKNKVTSFIDDLKSKLEFTGLTVNIDD